ncbi:MAG: hypothetical protein WC350_00100 [Candidatus Micrarchaeia archaeon]|jgi:hypothetical protein
MRLVLMQAKGKGHAAQGGAFAKSNPLLGGLPSPHSGSAARGTARAPPPVEKAACEEADCDEGSQARQEETMQDDSLEHATQSFIRALDKRMRKQAEQMKKAWTRIHLGKPGAGDAPHL